MIQLILHLIGDYVTQSQWMAENKTKSSVAAGAHAVTYSLPFLVLQPSWAAFAVILGTHFLIDRFSLAKYVAWVKNSFLRIRPWQPDSFGDSFHEEWVKFAADRDRYLWHNCRATGYPSDLPPWLAVWLLIACDNTLHLAINYAALRWL